jgi:glycogen(starch) synthase
MNRILMTSDVVGGVWTYTLELVRRLALHQIEVAVAVMGPAPDAAQCSEFASIANARLFHRPFALEWMNDPWLDVDRAGEWLLDLAAGFAPDLIHLNGYAHASLPWPVPVFVVAHSCVLTWWRAVYGEAAPSRFAEYRHRVENGLVAADQVITPTDAFREALQEEYGRILPGHTIHNARASSRDGQSGKEPEILCAGRLWDRAKNISLLERVASKTVWPIAVAGEGLPQGDLRNLGRLPREELDRRLSAAAIYAAPAFYEPFGLSILEAATHGCALVLSDIPSLRELWDDCAWFVQPTDEEGWASAFNMLAQDSVELVRLQQAARERARAFSPARQAEAYLAAYRLLIAEHSRPAELTTR